MAFVYYLNLELFIIYVILKYCPLIIIKVNVFHTRYPIISNINVNHFDIICKTIWMHLITSTVLTIFRSKCYLDQFRSSILFLPWFIKNYRYPWFLNSTNTSRNLWRAAIFYCNLLKWVATFQLDSFRNSFAF